MSASLRRFTAALTAVIVGATGLVLSFNCGDWADVVGTLSVSLMGLGLFRLNDWCEEE